MYKELVKKLRHLDEYSKQINPTPSGIFKEAADAIEALSKQNEEWEEVVKTALDLIPCWIPVTDIEHLPNTDSGVVGYFGGGAFGQLRWYDFVCTASDGTVVGESTKRDVMNKHCIAVFKLPEPPKEET